MGIENLFLGFQIAITPYNLFVAVIGITLGTIIGVLPGLGGANGVAILLPLTFTMPPTSAIILLTSLYWGALFGGAITSVLFNIPGEPWSVATTFRSEEHTSELQSHHDLVCRLLLEKK